MRLLTVPELVIDAGQRFGAAAFLGDGTQTLGFATVAQRVARGAGALRKHGVVAGDRVAIVAPNGVEPIVAWLASIHAGAIPAVLNPSLTEPEFAYAFGDLTPRLVLIDSRNPSAAARAASRAANIAQIDCALASNEEPIEPTRALASDVAAIVYTSGTTSRPKGALVRHLAYTGAGQSMPAWLRLGEVEHLWAMLPFFHINAQAYSLMTALANGYRLTISEKFRASTFWQDAARLDVTVVNVIGAMLAILAKGESADRVAGPLHLVYAAPALEPSANRDFEARFGVRIASGYGMSENVFGTIESATSRAKAGSIGRPRSHPAGLIPNEMRLVTPDGELAEPGAVGELQFRNAAVTPGYWNAPEITAKALGGGWLHTGDAGYLDADGDIVLVARYKEMIRRRGENIAPGEVEDAIALHPDVIAVAVIGVPSPLSEEDVVACVVARPNVVLDDVALRAWCEARLASYKIPTRFIIRDALPLTPTMRVAKDRLKAEITA